MATAVDPATETYRTALVALLGMFGCGLALVATTPLEPVTTRKLMALGLGLLLAFVGLAGVLDALR